VTKWLANRHCSQSREADPVNFALRPGK